MRREVKRLAGAEVPKNSFWTVPNTISLIRLPLLTMIIYLILISFNSFISAALILILFSMDLLDGYLARKFHQETKSGEILDEIIDRIIENTLFILFAYLNYIPIWAPIIMVLRAFIVDGIVLHYKTKTNSPDTIKSERYNSLIRSDWSRGGYGFLKMLLFVGLVFYPTISSIYQTGLLLLTVLVVLFSLFRGYVKIKTYL